MTQLVHSTVLWAQVQMLRDRSLAAEMCVCLVAWCGPVHSILQRCVFGLVSYAYMYTLV